MQKGEKLQTTFEEAMPKEADKQACQASDGEEDLGGDLSWNEGIPAVIIDVFSSLYVSCSGFTKCLAAVQSGGEAAGVGVGGNVRGWGVQHGVSDNDGVDHALTGDGGEHHGGPVCWLQRHDLNGTRWGSVF